MNDFLIKCFFEGAKCLNFTEAASNLFITQPAFSRNIYCMEKELGFKLFVRDNKRKDTNLTQAGMFFYEEMQKISVYYNELINKAASIYEGKSGKLNIGFLDSERIDERVIMIIEKFHEEYPNVELNYRRGSYRELVTWLKDDCIDISITLLIDVIDKKWIEYTELYKAQPVLVVSAQHPLSDADVETLCLFDFRNDTFIGLSSDDSKAVSELLINECIKEDFDPQILHAPDLKTQLLWLEIGRGVAIASVNSLSVANPRLKPLKLKDLIPISYAVAWNKENKSLRISNFLSCC